MTRSAPRVWSCVVAIGLAGCATLRAQPTQSADINPTVSLGLVVDTHPQQSGVIEFERRVVEALGHALAGVADAGFVVSYSDRVQLIGEWSTLAAGLGEASTRLSVANTAGDTRGAVLNDGLLDGLTKLRDLPNGGRRVLIVIGEGNDGGSAATFSQIIDTARAQHIQCFVLLVAQHRSQVGRVRQFGFDLYRMASATRGKAYDIRTSPKLLDEALRGVLKQLMAPIPS